MKSIYADIITIGDELLIGQITDTNSQWISSQLDKIGIQTKRKTSVGDNKEDILSILSEAEKRSDIIIITGGLGPTNDDITKNTLAEYFKTKLLLHPIALEDITKLFERKGKALSETNKAQAYLPENCTYLKNENGTAPGMWFEKNNKIYISMAGVPFEMKDLMSTHALPKLQLYFKTPEIIHKFIHTIGIGESNLSDLIKDWEANLPAYCKLAYLPSLGGLKLRISAINNSKENITAEIEARIKSLTTLIGEYIFAYSEESLAQVIGQTLKDKNLTVSTAESCTGGFLSHLFTSNPGSSAYFKGGIIAYHNEVKQAQLEVSNEMLTEYGAVSEQTVKQMAEEVRKKFNTDIGVATSGIAGPDGGTPDKPVGTVWIAVSYSNKTETKKLVLGTKRDVNIILSSNYALDLIRKAI